MRSFAAWRLRPLLDHSETGQIAISMARTRRPGLLAIPLPLIPGALFFLRGDTNKPHSHHRLRSDGSGRVSNRRWDRPRSLDKFRAHSSILDRSSNAQPSVTQGLFAVTFLTFIFSHLLVWVDAILHDDQPVCMIRIAVVQVKSASDRFEHNAELYRQIVCLRFRLEPTLLDGRVWYKKAPLLGPQLMKIQIFKDYKNIVSKQPTPNWEQHLNKLMRQTR